MKRLLLTTLFAVPALFAQAAPASVYILPMAGGLDQYIAARLTRDKVLPVVADPKAAGIVLTDRIGEAFEQRLTQLVPPVKPETDEDDSKPRVQDNLHPAFQSSARRGTFFLVDAKTRQVVWSGYLRPVSHATPDSLDREAARLAKNLKATFGK
jgi:hypothetical protein